MAKSNVLVSYGWCRNSWALVRNLSRHGLNVHVADSSNIAMSRFSRYCKGFHRYPSFHVFPDEFIESLINYIISRDIDTYIPVHEETFVVAKYIHKFPLHVKIPISDYKTLTKLHNKKVCESLVKQLGISTPNTASFSTFDEASLYLHTIDYPIVLKLLNSNGSKGVWFSQDGYSALNLLNCIQQTFSFSEVPIIQERVSGIMYAVSILALNGKPITQFIRRNIREKDSFGGTCTKCQSIYFSDLLNAAKKIVSSVHFTGPIMMEFLVDEKTGKFWFIEANPRYWGTTSHDIDCGLDIPLFHYQLAQNPCFDFPEPFLYDENIKSRWILGDFIAFLKNLNPSVFSLSRLLSFFRVDDNFFMDLKFDDPLPFFFQAAFYFSKACSAKSFNPIDEGMIS